MATISKPTPLAKNLATVGLNRPCPVCGNASREECKGWCTVPEFEVLRCRHCNVTFINEVVDDNFGFTIGAQEKPDPVLVAKAAEDFKQLELRLADTDLIERHDRALLDVGCGTGCFLQEAKNAGWRVAGLELSTSLAAYARDKQGLEVDQASIESVTHYPSESFDVITMFGVIEHLAYPRRAAEECHRLLRPGGLLVLQTPSEDGFIRQFGHFLYWLSGGGVTFQINQLYQMGGGHSVCFNRSSMQTLLTLCGYEAIDFEQSTYGFRVLVHRFEDLPLAKKIVRASGTFLVFSVGMILGRSNHMTVYARK